VFLLLVELSDGGYYNMVNLNDGTLFFRPDCARNGELSYGHLAEECARLTSKLQRFTSPPSFLS
jgi:hypothetical protein